jgi:beta-fructofuranosidase
VLLALAVLFAGQTTKTMTNPTDQEARDLTAKAMAATKEAIPLASQDPSRPTFHFLPPSRWMNDPNGPIYYRGWYHLFYQFNPYGDAWGDMHWGHARSRDLVDWEHLPIALWPTKSKGEHHVFSGSTYLDDKGKPMIFYTSIGNPHPEQWIARPIDANLFRWTKPDENPVVSVGTHAPTVIDEWRDPFLFTEGGTTYMVVGGRHEGRGAVAAYQATSPQLTAWRYLGIVFHHPTANLIECPNLVKLGDRWLLLASHDGRVDWFSGTLDLATPRFHATRDGVLAEGSYASQLLTDKRGRTVHLAWVPTHDRKGWNGFMTLPSTLTLDPNGDVVRKPIEALTKLREEKLELKSTLVDGQLDLSDRIQGDRLELIADIDPGQAKKIHLRLQASKDGKRAVTITYDPQTQTLQTPNRTPIPLDAGNRLKLHLFLDKSALDVYANGGKSTQSTPLQSHPGDKGLQITTEGGPAKIRSLKVYTLRAARMDTTNFK